jgi:hypothetical protein
MTLKKSDWSTTHSACLLASISLKEVIPTQVLVGILKGQAPIGDWLSYIGVFFGECPARWIFGVMAENGLTLQDLEKCYKSLPECYQTLHFKEICKHAA